MMDVLISRAIGADGTALWPDYIPLETLEQKRAEAGSIIFGLQYQNDALLALGAVFRRGDFRWFDRAPEGLKVYQGVDLAISASETADYFTIATVGFSKESGEYYVLECISGRFSFLRQAGQIREAAARWKPSAIGIESTAYQAALADFLSGSAALPIRKINRRVDKEMRAWTLAALFEGGRIFLSQSQTELADELAAFPAGAHDDMFDALETAVSLARRPSTSIGKFKFIRGV
jgi:predicted phage terminase large subunit-like protein